MPSKKKTNTPKAEVKAASKTKKSAPVAKTSSLSLKTGGLHYAHTGGGFYGR